MLYEIDFYLDQQQIILLSHVEKKVSSKKEKTVVAPLRFGPDIYYHLRKAISPNLHKQYYPND